MRTVAAALALLIGCSSDGGGSDTTPLSARAAIAVTTEKAQTDASMDFGEPRFVVEVTDPNDCYVPDASFTGLFRGAPMEVIQRGQRTEAGCTPTRLAIAFDAVTAANDVVLVHDKDTSVSATFAPGVLDIRTATFGWQFQAGNVNVMAWSHPIQGTPRLSFCIPAMAGSQVFQTWTMHPAGVVSDQTIHFTLPSQLEFTGNGEAMIDVDGASGTAAGCTGSACTYDLAYFVIHSAIVNP